MQIAKWGNSLGLRLPAGLVKSLSLEPGQTCEVVAAAGRAFTVTVQPAAAAKLGELRRFRGRMPEGFRFDREEAQERR